MSVTIFGRRGSIVGAMVVTALALVAGPIRSAHAQGAWVGDPKSLSANFAYQYVPSSAVVITPDIKQDDRPTRNHVFTLAFEYVPIEHLALEASVPLAMVRYAGKASHIPPGEWDKDHNYHTTLTDARIGARYQVLDEHIVALSPFIALSAPLQKYEVIGFATGGRHLKQAHFGLSLGRTFEPAVPNLYVTGSYEFTLSEKSDVTPNAKNYSQNRSDLDAQLGYLLMDGKLNLNLAWSYRFQHDGIEFTDFPKINMTDPMLTLFHDPILKEKFMFVGGGASYAINDRFTLGLAVRFFLSGYNTRDQSLYGLDLTYNIR